MIPATILACKLIAFSQAVGTWRDRPVYVNPCLVASVTSSGPNSSIIFKPGTDPVVVKGTAEDVAEQVNRAIRLER